MTLESCFTTDPAGEQTLISQFIQLLADGLVKRYLFLLKLKALGEAILTLEQKDVIVIQDYVNSSSYCPSRRQEREGS